MMFQEDRLDPMIYIFPRMTKCTFHKFGTSGEVEKHDALCILPLNIGKAPGLRIDKSKCLDLIDFFILQEALLINSVISNSLKFWKAMLLTKSNQHNISKLLERDLSSISQETKQMRQLNSLTNLQPLIATSTIHQSI